MNADHLAFRRAMSVSLLGLVLQLVFALLLLVYGIVGGDPAAVTGATIMFVGLFAWGSLALVFNQHRLERLEALEQESYRASSLAEASVFEEDARGHRVQSERLNWMHRWLLPTVGLIVAALYITFGIVLLRGHSTDLAAQSGGEFAGPPHAGWAIAIGVGLAAAGFVFGRFVAGMAKQSAWNLLNAGAAAAVAASLIGLGLAVAHFLSAVVGTTAGLRVLPIVLDVFMLALGVEVLLNFVLSAYRPRKPGEFVRPAFDSRVLAFVAAPDRIAQSISEAVNYQFGFDVSGTWFYKLLSRSLAILLLLGVVVGWLMSSLQVVNPDERALVLRNGRLTETSGGGTSVGPGLVVSLPWPFSELLRFPASALNQIDAGDVRVGEQEPVILWTTQRTADVEYFVVRATDGAGADAVSELALLSVEVPVQYRVSDLERYVMLAQDAPPIFDEQLGRLRDDPERFRRELLRSIASRVAWQELASHSVDEVLGSARAEIADRVMTAVQREFDRASGEGAIEVVFTGLVGAAPEAETANAFEGVVSADSDRQARIERARAQEIAALAEVAGTVEQAERIIAALNERDRMLNAGERDRLEPLEERIIELIQASGGQASQVIERARAERWAKLLGARSQLVQSRGLSASYEAAPRLFRTSRRLELLRQLAAESRVWITPFPAEIEDRSGLEPQINIDGILGDDAGAP